MTRLIQRFVALSLFVGCAGASGPPPGAAPAPAVESVSSGSESPQPTAAGAVGPEDLRGTWVEYWAVAGGADTERYAFNEPGRFDWHASQREKAAEQSPIGKSGSFRLEPHGSATYLVLAIERETFGGPGVPREVQHPAPVVERHELGECPSNPEAKNIDASYTCRAIGGKAFWRKSG